MKTDHATPPSEAVGFTPGPWRVHGNIGRKSELGIMADKAPCIIATMSNAKAWPVEARANAAHIVLCVNSHDALLEACNDLLALCRGGTGNALQIMERAESAIRKSTP